MFERRIAHEGLKSYRVVRGPTELDVNAKANYQLLAWEDRWKRVKAAQDARDNRGAARWNKEQKIALAQTQTAEAAADIARATGILANTLGLAVFDWDSYKDTSHFGKQQPRKVEMQELPPAPERRHFAERLSLFDKLIPKLKRNKRVLEERRFTEAYRTWESQCSRIERENDDARKKDEKALADWKSEGQRFSQKQAEQHEEIEARRRAYLELDLDALQYYWDETLNFSEAPPQWPQEAAIAYLADTRVLVIDYELPSLELMPNVKEVKYIAVRSEFKISYLSDAELKRIYDDVLYKLALSILFRLFFTDEANALASVVVNGWVHAVDKATGIEIHPCILSVQASKEEFLALNLSQVDARMCFRKLKGVSASKLAELSPIKPVLVLNKVDSRFVPSYNVADGLDDRTNLAAMDWLDFENLIRELFEKEFRSSGGEVRITQASRDGGVDAIAFDPDPIRGGKIVIQAKRYTNVVGVSAVRDLYGTVHNEGATKGILVTTSNYGPDAYEFAKGKPLTLLSGSELLHLLQKHGHSAKIDIGAAKKILAIEAEQAFRGDMPPTVM